MKATAPIPSEGESNFRSEKRTTFTPAGIASSTGNVGQDAASFRLIAMLRIDITRASSSTALISKLRIETPSEFSNNAIILDLPDFDTHVNRQRPDSSCSTFRHPTPRRNDGRSTATSDFSWLVTSPASRRPTAGSRTTIAPSGLVDCFYLAADGCGESSHFRSPAAYCVPSSRNRNSVGLV